MRYNLLFLEKKIIITKDLQVCLTMNEKVWLFFILSIIIFAIVMTVVVLTRNRYSDIIIQQRHQSNWETLYQGFQYALTIITAQGKRHLALLK